LVSQSVSASGRLGCACSQSPPNSGRSASPHARSTDDIGGFTCSTCPAGKWSFSGDGKNLCTNCNTGTPCLHSIFSNSEVFAAQRTEPCCVHECQACTALAEAPLLRALAPARPGERQTESHSPLFHRVHIPNSFLLLCDCAWQIFLRLRLSQLDGVAVRCRCERKLNHCRISGFRVRWSHRCSVLQHEHEQDTTVLPARLCRRTAQRCPSVCMLEICTQPFIRLIMTCLVREQGRYCSSPTACTSSLCSGLCQAVRELACSSMRASSLLLPLAGCFARTSPTLWPLALSRPANPARLGGRFACRGRMAAALARLVPRVMALAMQASPCPLCSLSECDLALIRIVALCVSCC
jgi:hypothetical protein